MTESVDSGVTSHTDLGAWKKFCLKPPQTSLFHHSLLTNLVIVPPNDIIPGSVAYLNYVALSDKNGMKG